MGKPTINVSATLGINTKSAYRDVFNASEYMQYREDWYKVGTYGVNPATGKYEAYQTGQTNRVITIIRTIWGDMELRRSSGWHIARMSQENRH